MVYYQDLLWVLFFSMTSLNVLTVTPCFCLKLKSDLMGKRIVFLLNTAFAMAILHLIPLYVLHHFLSFYTNLKYYTISRCVDRNQSTSLLILFVQDVTPRCWVRGYRRFVRTVRLYLHGFKVGKLPNMDFESLMMTARSFETSGTSYPVTQCHIQKDCNSLLYRCYELRKLACGSVSWKVMTSADVKEPVRIQQSFAALFYPFFAYAHCSYANTIQQGYSNYGPRAKTGPPHSLTF